MKKLQIPKFLVFCCVLTASQSAFSQLNCIDSAVYLNGNNQYITLAPNTVSDTNFLANLSGDYTIECLLKWNGGAPFQRIFDFSFGNTFFMFLTPSQNAIGGVPRFAISTTGLTAPQVVDATVPLLPGIYHHIAVTYSKASSMVTIFIDGANVGSGTVNIDADSVYHGTDMHDSSVNYIGLSSFSGDPQFDGNIDEFRISDTVRYTDNFTPAIPFSPDGYTVALYHFDEGSGQNLIDASGNNYTAILGSTADVDVNDPSRISCAGVLATSLLNFTATNVSGKVQLNWQTTSEINNNYFEVEKSINGVNFSAAAKVAATNKNGINKYAYTDVSPNTGSNYYRLKQVDNNGSFKYSSVVYINITGNNNFKVYPTLAHDRLHVTVSQTPATLVIFNEMGKAVKTMRINNTEEDVDVSNLPAGNYIIRNITSNASLKLIKQ